MVILSTLTIPYLAFLTKVLKMCTLGPEIWIWVQPTDHGRTSRGRLMIQPQLLPRDSKGKKERKSLLFLCLTEHFMAKIHHYVHTLLCGRSMNDAPIINASKTNSRVSRALSKVPMIFLPLQNSSQYYLFTFMLNGRRLTCKFRDVDVLS